jgi:hypothetical protein
MSYERQQQQKDIDLRRREKKEVVLRAQRRADKHPRTYSTLADTFPRGSAKGQGYSDDE